MQQFFVALFQLFDVKSKSLEENDSSSFHQEVLIWLIDWFPLRPIPLRSELISPRR